MTNDTAGVNNSSESRVITGFDALKLILAIVVVVMHAEFKLWDECPVWIKVILSAVSGAAVPAFFILSGYLFFNKVQQMKSLKEQLRALLHYEKRIFVLYLFWTIVLMYWIIQFWHPEYAEPSFEHLRLFVEQFFFGSQFNASWFLGVLIVGVPIVYLLGKLFGSKWIWIIPLIIYIYVYFGPANETFCNVYRNRFHQRADLSFISGLLPLAIGWMLYRDNLKKVAYALPVWALWGILIVGTITKCVWLTYEPIFDIVQALIIMLLAYRWRCPMSRQLSIRLRTYSTHIFCIHTTVIFLIWQSDLSFAHNPLYVAPVAVVISFILSECLILLMRVPGLKWLKYSK